MIKKFIKRLIDALKNLPPLYNFLRRIYHFKIVHRNTIKLINNKHSSKSDHPSIIHFSMNKAATQYIKSLLIESCQKIHMTHIDIQHYAFVSEFPYMSRLNKEEMKQYQYLFKPTGYLYSAIDGMVEGIEQLDNFKIILVVRDPRDMLVSEYFSVAYSHTLPPEGTQKHQVFTEKRQNALEIGIENYVLHHAYSLRDTFIKYQDCLIKHYNNVYITSYEEMINDFESWLTQLLTFCDLPIEDESFKNMIFQHKQKMPSKEDKNKHLRKGTSGDYKEKLSKETIAKLNGIFGNVLTDFGYEID